MHGGFVNLSLVPEAALGVHKCGGVCCLCERTHVAGTGDGLGERGPGPVLQPVELV